MEMVKVDPKLFVTCRLCLEDMGMYQITPTVQNQIKYCFDIDVDPFDGLPQLICKNCETILSEYYTKKRIFVGRQNALKARLEVRKDIEEDCALQIQDDVRSSQNDNECNKRNISKPKRLLYRELSSSSSSDDSRAKFSPQIERKPKTKKRKNTSAPWEAYYNKKYVCRFCDKHLKFKSNLTNHMKKHTNLLSKHEDILNVPCMVNLEKIDDKPNITGTLDAVMVSHGKLIRQPSRSDCYIIYFPKVEHNTKSSVGCDKSDDSDDQSIKMPSHKKRRRLLSKSSNDTVVLTDENEMTISSGDEDNSTSAHQRPESAVSSGDEDKSISAHQRPESAGIECINIDDSSNSSSNSYTCRYKGNDKSPRNEISAPYERAIQQLINCCSQKYMSILQKNNGNLSSKTNALMKHKILSMGLKLISNQHVQCTGLLRYMEYNNLEIKWIPTNSSTNHVRIMPKLRGKDTAASDNTGWRDMREVQDDSKNEKSNSLLDINNSTCKADTKKDQNASFNKQVKSKDKSSFLKDHEYLKRDSSEKCKIDKAYSKEENNTVHNGSGSSRDQMIIQRKLLHLSSDTELIPCKETSTKYSTTISFEKQKVNDQESMQPDSDKKLLNANPVANPKQLPKKCGTTDSNPHIRTVVMTNNPKQDSICLDFLGNLHNDKESCMPIITSTSSLAVLSSADNNDNKVDRTNAISGTDSSMTEKSAPRIKVKAASELMSERALKTLSQQQSPVSGGVQGQIMMPAIQNTFSIATPAQVVMKHGQPQLVPMMKSPADSLPKKSLGSVTLDTVEFPNAKTDSPFRYVKNLLETHNIILLNFREPVPTNFALLIKFKLQFSNGMGERNSVKPVLLNMSLHCAENTFCLKVKDENEINIDISAVSANWQWEILKIYVTREDITNKMLNNASNMGPNVFMNTKTFLSLLKSVKFIG